MVLGDQLVIGCGLKGSKLYLFDIMSLELAATSSEVWESVRTLCKIDSQTFFFAMANSMIGIARAGKSYLEIIAQKTLHKVQPFWSIVPTSRQEFALCTAGGLVFVSWDANAKEVIIVKTGPTSSQFLTFLQGRQTFVAIEVTDDLILTSDYN